MTQKSVAGASLLNINGRHPACVTTESYQTLLCKKIDWTNVTSGIHGTEFGHRVLFRPLRVLPTASLETYECKLVKKMTYRITPMDDLETRVRQPVTRSVS
jgi:hypothetical protein